MQNARSPSHSFRQKIQEVVPGLLFCLVITGAAAFLAASHGGPVVLYALLLGMAFNFLADDPRFMPGLALASQLILRVGVALLGSRITLGLVGDIGLPMLASIVVIVLATIAFGFGAAHTLDLPKRLGVLTAGATAICGASAAAALAAVLPRDANRERDTAFTIIGVTTLSTVAMVLYPAIARSIGFDDKEIGIFIGATIHDVAQVVGAGYSVSPLAGDKATIVKLFRVALLVPIVLGVALIARRLEPSVKATSKGLLPGFLVAFVVLVLANSAGWVPPSVGEALGHASRWCIVIAIAAVGVKTSLKSFIGVGQPAVGMLIAQTLVLAVLAIAAILLLR